MNCTLIRLALFALVSMPSSTVQNVRAEERLPADPGPLRQAADQRTNAMKIRIKVGDKVMTATLVDNATSRDFVSLLPLELALEDYAATEKIGYLPRKLSSDGAPPGSKPSAGDISYYSSGLIQLGRIDIGAEALNMPSMKVSIELLDGSP